MSRATVTVGSAVVLLMLFVSVAGAQVITQTPAPGQELTDFQNLMRASFYRIPLATQTSTLYDTGERIEFPCEEVWREIPGPSGELLTEDDLAEMAATHAADFADPTQLTIIGANGTRTGLNVVYVLASSVPSAAVPAFQAAEAYLEGVFINDPITVTIQVSFASLGSGIIGGTSCSYGYVDWATSRSALVGGMDGSDVVQSYLPTTSTIPVRYSSGTTTAETRVFWTFANWKATGGTVSGDDAAMQFSTNFPFDYDPSNGVGTSTISLQDVIIHETGHALGFTSGIDFRYRDIETLDCFRFNRLDGSGDFNPDTYAEFQARPRWCVYNYQDAHNFDIISVEYRMSDGSPYQASHFREQTPAIGIMDPAFNYGETFYPTFLRTSDLTAFDAIGWDL